MIEIYFVIVGFLLLLAVFDLYVGVSNDAVNFLNSAIGAKVARFKTVIMVASVGVLVGAMMSSGMMDVARHGILQPASYSFEEVMVIFLAVMVTDVVILDVFNSLGMPTSTTVSLVFELLGATFITACIKVWNDSTLSFGMLLNSDKALSVIIAIFVSVAIAFVAGAVVQWLLRLTFTFDYKRRLKYFIGIFGGIAFTSMSYFIFIKGLGKSPYIAEEVRGWIDTNTDMLLVVCFFATAIMSQVFHWLGVNVLRIVVLLGTFSLAMAFAGNDLVNFIGVPLAALDSMKDFVANGNGNFSGFMMTSLQESARSPLAILALAGVIMIISMVVSKKARNVVKTSVDLSRQDEGDEMFGSSRVARSIVRASQNVGDVCGQLFPESVRKWVAGRFNKEEATLEKGAAFDEIRAAVNLVLAALLIIMGTTMKLPLSTTYVTFMVAMGSSLADKAWGRESAVFRITGVLSVIGGWFITAGLAFVASALVCSIIHFGGFVTMFAFMALAAYLLWSSNRKYNKKIKDEKDNEMERILAINDSLQLWSALCEHFIEHQSFITKIVHDDYAKIIAAIEQNDRHVLRKVRANMQEASLAYKRNRRLELLALRRAPINKALERNTWFHLAQNSNQQYLYCMKRILDPVLEHVENSFTPIPVAYMEEFSEILKCVDSLFIQTHEMISTKQFADYHRIMDEADSLKDSLSRLRKVHIDRAQLDSNVNLRASQLYLNLIQETQELLSIMRHQLRATKRFVQPGKEK